MIKKSIGQKYDCPIRQLYFGTCRCPLDVFNQSLHLRFLHAELTTVESLMNSRLKPFTILVQVTMARFLSGKQNIFQNKENVFRI
jgi:hypothetical protein